MQIHAITEIYANAHRWKAFHLKSYDGTITLIFKFECETRRDDYYERFQ